MSSCRRRGEPRPKLMPSRSTERALRNKTLWEVHGAERIVFDITTILATAEGASHPAVAARRALVTLLSPPSGESPIPLEAVKSFGIAVPNVNLPPTSRNGDFGWSPDQTRFARSESQFDYYFSLLLRNGTSVEYPAGQAAFIPASEPLPLNLPTENVTIVLEQPTEDDDWGSLSRGNCVSLTTPYAQRRDS